MIKEIAIVGAGASGLMCAANLIKNKNVKITIFDKNETSGKKLLITGNGRCNVTNLLSSLDFLENVVQNSKFLTSAIHTFSPQDMVNFLHKNNVDTVVENNNRVFPQCNKAASVKNMFDELINSSRVTLRYNTKVSSIAQKHTGFEVCFNEQCQIFDVVIIATGGRSFPVLGCTGDGYEFAKNLGHSVIATRPALCGIKLADNFFTQLEGVPFKAKLTYCSNKNKVSVVGDVMYTSYGISGPATFKLSSLITDFSIFNNNIVFDFMPDCAHEHLLNSFKTESKKTPKKQLFNFVCGFINAKLAKIILQKNNCNFYKQVAEVSNAEWNAIASQIKNFNCKAVEFDAIERATITRGGVNVKNINAKTMCSKLINNLYFIGEVIDVDALSGGFNLQIAFSTAVACAKHINSTLSFNSCI